MSPKVRLILSMVIAVGFLLVSYCVTNLRLPISGEKEILTKLEMASGYFFPVENKPVDSILFIDVSFDKELAPVVDERYMPAGKMQITDRKKLLKLLLFLKQEGNYKYILLDVFFGTKVATDTKTDSALFETILSMDNIVIPRHHEEDLADERLLKIAGIADYVTTSSESDFVKYPYMSDWGKSLPLRMYEDNTGRTIKRHGWFYTDGWKLVRSSVVLTYELAIKEAYADNDEKIWYNLGTDLLGDTIPQFDYVGDGDLNRISDLTQGKYIVVGAFRNGDTHNTMIGSIPGAVINMNAYLSLLHGHHVASVPFILILFLIFTALTYLTISQQRLEELLDRAADMSKSLTLRRMCRAVSWLCSWIGYSLLLIILCIATYYLLGEAYDIFVTSTLFYVFHLIVCGVVKIKSSRLWNRES